MAGTLSTAAAIVMAGAASTWLVLAAALFVAGAMDAVVDVAQNTHGLRVQRLYGRSIINSLHATWSIGAVLGGLMGAAAAGSDIPVTTHVLGSGALLGCVALTAYRFMLPGREDAERGEVPPIGSTDTLNQERSAAQYRLGSGPGRRFAVAGLGTLLALGVIAGSGAVVEDAGASWGAIYLVGSLAAAPAVAGFANVALQGMQFVGRLLGDRLVDRYGQRSVARAGASITAVGMGAALAVPSTATTLVGFGAAGLGVATLIPAAMHAADALPGLSPGTGLTVVSWLLRLGFLLSPPIVGSLADAVSLRAALLVVPVAAVTVLALSYRLADA